MNLPDMPELPDLTSQNPETIPPQRADTRIVDSSDGPPPTEPNFRVANLPELPSLELSSEHPIRESQGVSVEIGKGSAESAPAVPGALQGRLPDLPDTTSFAAPQSSPPGLSSYSGPTSQLPSLPTNEIATASQLPSVDRLSVPSSPGPSGMNRVAVLLEQMLRSMGQQGSQAPAPTLPDGPKNEYHRSFFGGDPAAREGYAAASPSVNASSRAGVGGAGRRGLGSGYAGFGTLAAGGHALPPGGSYYEPGRDD